MGGKPKLRARFVALLDELRRWADDDRGLAPPATPAEIAALPGAVKPHFGECRWTVPSSYATFLSITRGFATGRYDEDDLFIGCDVFDAEEMRTHNLELVHMPANVDRGDGRALSTNHLVGFAGTRGEGVWCFCIDHPGPELPVYYHHQDYPRARFVATGEWEDPERSAPEFDRFASWFEYHVRDLIDHRGEVTASGDPWAYMALHRDETSKPSK